MTVQVTQAICCHPCHAMFRLCRHFSAGTGSSDHGPNDEYPNRTVPAQNFSQIRDANRTEIVHFNSPRASPAAYQKLITKTISLSLPNSGFYVFFTHYCSRLPKTHYQYFSLTCVPYLSVGNLFVPPSLSSLSWLRRQPDSSLSALLLLTQTVGYELLNS